ncbi:hypothetical protein BDW74DRAFT_182780 [Aspergillus multicolor]|uniref:uncharacterized protein n=1 Tax=Aspergillus multicolor TaxID=41759 RepID=UPI003CCE2EA5
MIALCLFAIITAAAATFCRCFPSDRCWPSDETWSKFNDSVNGRLIRTVPLAAPCHDPQYDAAFCAWLQVSWFVPEPHYDSSSSLMAPYFGNNTCDPFHPREQPCLLGNYVVYAVNVSEPEDVIKTLKFADKHNIRFVIRNTGHDFEGKSTGAGGLAVWVHFLKNITINDHYRDKNYEGPAMTMGAGVQGLEALAAADEKGYRVVVGEAPAVGVVGGYTQGAGHSSLSSRYGMAADQTLAWEVIDGKGRHLVATRDNEHSDLYWALSGGGGGTYAVVLSLAVKLFPDGPTSGLSLILPRQDLSSDRYWEAVNLFSPNLPAIVDAGAQVTTSVTNVSFSIGPMTGPDIPVDELVRLITPYTAQLDALGLAYVLIPSQYPTYLSQYEGMMQPMPINIAQYGAWLLPRKLIERNNSAVTAAFRAIVEDGLVIIGNTCLNVSKEVAGDVYNSVLPAWRETLIHVIIRTTWIYNLDAQNLDLVRRNTEEFVPRLTALAPKSGAYLSEGDFQQPHFQWVYFGKHYPRLRKIKFEYDPNHIFYAPTTVGSEEWTQRADRRLCRVDDGDHGGDHGGDDDGNHDGDGDDGGDNGDDEDYGIWEL